LGESGIIILREGKWIGTLTKATNTHTIQIIKDMCVFFFLEHAGELRIISLKGEENVVHTPPKKLEKLIT
jgi:hypothetical protein